MSQKVILPGEVKVCATCSYWDGERQVDDELNVVVVDEASAGECLVQECRLPGVHDVRQESVCLWESLAQDDTETGKK